MWFRLADRLKMSVNRCKAETTSSQFVKWNQYIKDDVNNFHREDWLAAQVCFFIRLIPNLMFGGKIDYKVEDFLVKFKTSDASIEDSDEVEDTRPTSIEESGTRSMRGDDDADPLLDNIVKYARKGRNNTKHSPIPHIPEPVDIPYDPSKGYGYSQDTSNIPEDELEDRIKASVGMKNIFFSALKLAPDGTRLPREP